MRLCHVASHWADTPLCTLSLARSKTDYETFLADEQRLKAAQSALKGEDVTPEQVSCARHACLMMFPCQVCCWVQFAPT